MYMYIHYIDILYRIRAADKHPATPAIAGGLIELGGLEISFEHRLVTDRNVCLYLPSNKLQYTGCSKSPTRSKKF